MRKLFWCGSAAGVLTLGGLFSAAFYGCCYPDSTVGHCLHKAASASVALQPVSSFAAMMARASQHAIDPQETAAVTGGSEECIPDDPQPIAPETSELRGEQLTLNDERPHADPIVIREEVPAPAELSPQVPATIELAGRPSVPDVPDHVCPLVMPYCSDDEETPAVKPVMPLAEEDQPKAAAEESEEKDFKEWMKLFKKSDKESKAAVAAEELPPPQENPHSEPKCEEDSRIFEHYSGYPHTTCPYTGKTYPSTAGKKMGKEESSEEPPVLHRTKKHSFKGKDKESSPHTEGVDTMEYRPSDGGLNEYGTGPL